MNLKVTSVLVRFLAILRSARIFSDSNPETWRVGGLMVSADRVVRVRALAGDMVLCSRARRFTLAMPLSAQVYCINGYRQT